MRQCIWLLSIILLSGCGIQGKIGSDVSLDATSAIKLANAIGDTSVVPCYQHIGAVGTAVADISPTTPSVIMSLGSVQLGAVATSKRLELLTAYEASRAFKGIGQDPACAQVWLDLANIILKASIPGLGALLP